MKATGYTRFAMTILAAAAACCAAALTAAGAEQKKNDRSHNVPPEGFVALFNGENVDGWFGLPHRDSNPADWAKMTPAEREALKAKHFEEFRKHWRVEEGELVNDGQGPYATTDRWYGDFELLIDYKTVPKADSGIYLRGTPQVQIWDYTKEGGKWDRGADKGSGGLWNNQKHERFPYVLADKPFGEWNHFRIRMVGELVTVWLNDKLVVNEVPLENYWDRSRPVIPVGPIQLQTHGGEIRWRNIFLKEIPRRPPESGVLDKNGKPAGEGWTALLSQNETAQGKLVPRDRWRLEGGVLTAESAGTNEDILAITADEFGDFELHAQVRLGGERPLALFGLRVDPSNLTGSAAPLLTMGSYRRWAWGSVVEESDESALSSFPANEADKIIRPDDWNHLYVRADGEHIACWWNGTRTAEFLHPRGPAKGALALLLDARQNREMALSVRDVFIRPLNDKAAAETSASDDEKGFVSLFNGQDLSGWTGDTDGYAARAGVLVARKGHGGNLYYDKPFSDFILRFEFALEENGNNGVGIRAEKGKNAAYHGMELQILDNTGPQYQNLKPYQYHGSIYGVVPAKRGHQRPLGHWNEQEIYAKGNHVRVTLNGQVIVDADIAEAAKGGTMDGREHPGLFNQSGYIGFLGHGHRIRFRNIRIKPLD